MTTPIRVDDAADPRLDDYRTLRDPELRKRYENEAGVFIAEGPNVVAELLSSRFPVRSLLLSPKALGRLAPLEIDAPVYLAARSLIEEVVAFPMHQGALAVGGRLPDLGTADVVDAADTIVFLEEMNDPENMGVLFRSARALGVGGVLLGRRCSDPLYRRCVRVSMGHVLHVPFTTTDDPGHALAGFTTVALATDGEITLKEFAADRPARVALLLGAEGPGLSADARERAAVRVRIEMDPAVDSLNVATAAAIALHALR